MRPYRDSDLPALQEAVSAWIAQVGRCGYDHVGELPHRIYENLRGSHPVGDLVQVWEDGPAIAGVGINLRFGAAFDVFTAPALRGSPAEEEMLRAAIETTEALTTEPHVLTDVFDCDTTRAALLRGFGFAYFRTWDDIRERPLDGPLPPAPLPPGFHLREATFADAEGLARARNASFDAEWTGRLYHDEVMAKPGYDPAREIVAVAPDGRIAAYTVYWMDSRNRTGHFEPVGTHAAFRRLGLARAVMREAMARMERAGMATVTVNHNADNVPARRLYEELGFTKRYETHGYRRAV
ncbi:GNAT family N-acetyltransferase [Phytohabitans kaempferiae]|uniref:GNAT family N-acetyltransferase n=1 Tax=Phytohabitans kaempferiae TaxID=1620943 RepID=A0ABV6LXN6_9ACTN